MDSKNIVPRKYSQKVTVVCWLGYLLSLIAFTVCLYVVFIKSEGDLIAATKSSIFQLAFSLFIVSFLVGEVGLRKLKSIQ